MQCEEYNNHYLSEKITHHEIDVVNDHSDLYRPLLVRYFTSYAILLAYTRPSDHVGYYGSVEPYALNHDYKDDNTCNRNYYYFLIIHLHEVQDHDEMVEPV